MSRRYIPAPTLLFESARKVADIITVKTTVFLKPSCLLYNKPLLPVQNGFSLVDQPICLWDNSLSMHNNSSSSTAIAEYDRKNYDYSRYWEGGKRQYEHTSEGIALRRMIRNIPDRKNKIFADFGGGYGRLIPVYAQDFKHIVLLDYSVNNLKKAAIATKENGISNVSFVAANLYHLPFADHSLDCGQLVRVIHHIKDFGRLAREITRAVNNHLIVDCPNKRHFLAVARSAFGKNRPLSETLSIKPYKQPHRKDSEDFCGSETIFLNYHPMHIIQQIESVSPSATAKDKSNFKRKKTLSVSNFRHPSIKRVLPLAVLLALERVMQYIGTLCYFGPNIWILFEKKEKQSEKPQHGNFDISAVFVCPKCRGALKFSNAESKCQKCGASWPFIDCKIWDFRYTEK